MGLPRKVLAALVLEDIETPTEVQEAVIPDALAGHDVLGRARTGSGKTLAFGIPIVARLAGEKSRIHRPRALVIVPTRELAGQVERSLQLIAQATKLKLATVYGGTRYDKQIQQLRQGTDIVVATPGRLQDLIDKGIVRLDDVEITVLDEADHLCDLGFYPAVDQLLAQTPEGGQRMLLSATLDGDVDALVRTHLRDPKRHEVDPNAGSVTTMDHHVLVVGGFHDKVAAAVALVEDNPRAIVFTRTRDGAMELRDAMGSHGITAVDLHGNLTQRVRERNLERFSTGQADVVVATDVAARGIHVDGVEMVIHFDPPSDPKAYLHRSGRTARAGESGAVVTIVTPRQVDTVVSMQQQAGVTALHHDLRSTPRPMTALLLAEVGSPAPTVRAHRTGGSRPAGRQGGYQRRSPGGHPARRTGGRPAGQETTGKAYGGGKPAGKAYGSSKPAAKSYGSSKPAGKTYGGTKPAGSRPSSKKARWTQAEKNARR